MVDIALAVYNGQKYLKQQLDSLISQTYKDFRVFIGDDGSTDNSYGIIKEYIKKYPGKFEYKLNETGEKSPKNNFYKTIKRCSAPYVMTCDQDDVWIPQKIEFTLKLMEQTQRKNKGKPTLVHTDLKVVDENLKVISNSMMKTQKLNKHQNRLNQVLVQNNVTGCTVMINESLKNKIRSMPQQATMHDWWMALIAVAFGDVAYLDMPTVLYRQHGQNNVGAKNINDINFIIKRALKGENIKKAMNDTYLQAQSFLDEYKDELKSRDVEVIERFISIKDASKLDKIKIIKQNKFYKHGFIRRIGQYIYI